jgi:hypothetical protein
VSGSEERLPVSFVAFIISLASNAAVHFGDRPDPTSGALRSPDLDAASQLIEIIAMLQDKTKGNLTAEERQLVDQVLLELRLRHAEARKAQSPIVQP